MKMDSSSECSLMEVNSQIIDEAKTLGQYYLVQTILTAVGKSIITGRPVTIRHPQKNRPDDVLTSFEQFKYWLKTYHSDILEM